MRKNNVLLFVLATLVSIATGSRAEEADIKVGATPKISRKKIALRVAKILGYATEFGVTTSAFILFQLESESDLNVQKALDDKSALRLYLITPFTFPLFHSSYSLYKEIKALITDLQIAG